MNHSPQNHDTHSAIFINTKEMMQHDLKHLNRRVKTARVIIIVAASLLLLSSLIFLKDSNREMLMQDWFLAVVPVSGISFMLLALLSFRQPFIFLLIPTTLWCLGVLITIYQLLFLSSPAMTDIGRIAVQLVLSLYLIRGVIAAKKAQQLKDAIAG